MKLDLDCVRKIMLAVEDKPLNEILNPEKLHRLLPEFSEDEITYCCLKLDEAGLLEIVSIKLMRQNHPGIKSVNDLTFQGHQFLENIRDDSVYFEVKKKAKSVGSFALLA